MLADGQPDVTNAEVDQRRGVRQGLWDAGVIAPGSFTMKEQDKVEEFTNGRVGMMIDSLSHINLIRENNPDLNFDISAIPSGGRLRRRARHPLRLVGHRHLRQQRAQGRGAQARRVPDEHRRQLRAVDASPTRSRATPTRRRTSARATSCSRRRSRSTRAATRRTSSSACRSRRTSCATSTTEFQKTAQRRPVGRGHAAARPGRLDGGVLGPVHPRVTPRAVAARPVRRR